MSAKREIIRGRRSLCDWIRPRSGRRCAALLVTLAVGACQEPKEHHPVPSSQPIVLERQLPMRAQPTLIKHGRLPLAYLVDSSSNLRFVDLTAGKELARALVQPRQVVSIDARRGVCLGEVVLRPGPLAGDHDYGIWFDPTGDSVFRSEIINPPATQPTEGR